MNALITVSDLRESAAPTAGSLRAPPRFARVTFESYHPQHPSQAHAREAVRSFVLAADEGNGVPGGAVRARRGSLAKLFALRRARKGAPSRGSGLYLDGGFGVGKTHLLAAAYSASASASKQYVSFQELVYLIGVLGMPRAKEELGASELLCIDEFELDDPGNTLLVKTFLETVLSNGGSVITTSNTPPEAQGRGRFNAEDFTREIQSLAGSFTVLRVDGPDYRHRAEQGAWLPRARFEELKGSEEFGGPALALDWQELLRLLNRVHPARFGGLLAQVSAVYLEGVEVIMEQSDALRFVHFVDKLYDLEVAFRATGNVPLPELFHSSYAAGAYAKKHHRCLSRLSELLSEAGGGEPLSEVSGDLGASSGRPHAQSASAPSALP